jgi:hypothetical protein
VIDFEEDLRPSLNATTYGIAGGGTWEVNRGIAVSVVVEESTSRLRRSQLTAMALLDLAFRPEL